MPKMKLTPAQKSFIERFYAYTAYGSRPRDYKPLGDRWGVQHRTMNWCRREGLIKKIDIGNWDLFVVDLEKARAMGLPIAEGPRIQKLLPRKRLVRFFTPVKSC
jgi:hypothetical protein